MEFPTYISIQNAQFSEHKLSVNLKREKKEKKWWFSKAFPTLSHCVIVFRIPSLKTYPKSTSFSCKTFFFKFQQIKWHVDNSEIEDVTIIIRLCLGTA